MQEECYDYYEEYLGTDKRGCCLICPDAEPDCLCYDCKCKKCYWYSEEYGEGSCDLKLEFKREKKEKYEIANSFGNKQIKNIIKQTEKAYYATIENSSKFIWIPKSVINNEGYIKNWFVEKNFVVRS